MERCQVVYSVLKTQIQFGFYRSGDVLPSIETAASDFFVSVDTMRAAYLQLQREGFVTISTNIGTTVIKDYGKQEIEQNIQTFYAQRKHALIDLSRSLRPLLGHAQWIGFQNVPADIYSRIHGLESSTSRPEITVFKHIVQAYTALGNNLLLRLVWQIFMFCEVPFIIMPDNPWRAFALKEFSPCSLDCCMKQDWDSLRELVFASQDSLSLALCRFYDQRITMPPPEQEIPFQWNSYDKASQICYSLAMDLLISINKGRYPANTLLPSLSKLSHERQVSVSTVRRALTLLNGVGATRSMKRIGTRVLPLSETTRNCDFTSPVVRKRLLDMAQSLQFLTLSCRDIAKDTIRVLGEEELQMYRKRLSSLKDRQCYDLIGYTSMDFLTGSAPYQAVRTIYKELLQMLFWGYSLRNIWKNEASRITCYLPFFEEFDRSLAEKDAIYFSGKLEELMVQEFHFTIQTLVSLGIHEAGKLLVRGI